MTDFVTRYGTSGSHRAMSPALWGKCPRTAILSGHLDKGWGFIDDFLQAYAGTTDVAAAVGAWVVDNATAGTAALLDRAGGWMCVDAASSTADQGANVQRLSDTAGGECFYANADAEIFIEFRIEPSDLGGLTAGNGAQLFFGLHPRDTTIFAAGVLSGTDYIGLTYDAGDTAGSWQFTGEKSGTQDKNDTGVDIVDDGASDARQRIGFHIKGVTEAIPYINGVAYPAAKLPAAAIPTALMAPSIAVLSEGTVDPLVNVDWVACFQVQCLDA